MANADIAFDLSKNDLTIRGGDFVVTETVSDQNAALLLSKGMVSLSRPYMGIGFQERAVNGTLSAAQEMVADAKAQIREDGAREVTITLGQDGEEYVCNVAAIYG